MPAYAQLESADAVKSAAKDAGGRQSRSSCSLLLGWSLVSALFLLCSKNVRLPFRMFFKRLIGEPAQLPHTPCSAPWPADVLVVAVLDAAKGSAFKAFVEVAEALRNGEGQAAQR